jgi:hypothetical protein
LYSTAARILNHSRSSTTGTLSSFSAAPMILVILGRLPSVIVSAHGALRAVAGGVVAEGLHVKSLQTILGNRLLVMLTLMGSWELNNLLLNGVMHELRLIMNIQLSHEVKCVRFNRLYAHVQIGSDLFDGKALSERLQYLSLTRS